MSDAARLAHDVGKYVARIARNVSEGEPVPAGLLPLLCKDLYQLPSGGRASTRFDEIVAGLPLDERLERARSCLSEIDALEERLRGGDLIAASRACSLARAVDDLLRGVAKDAR